MADAVKRRTFNINDFNRRTMVQGAGLVMPEWLKKSIADRRQKVERFSWRLPTIVAALPGNTTHTTLMDAAIIAAKDGEHDN
jgi:hypothetical protein